MDSSVFMLYTSADPALPREAVLGEDGSERFRRYLPADRLMVNYVEDYPFPFVIGRLCWELPSLMPSDWDAQHANGKCSPVTVADIKAAIDATVSKQGIFSLCFHPHGWIAAEQVIELIDHAVTKYGSQVKFLTFPEVQKRLDQNLLGGHPLRSDDGGDNGVRLLDIDADGYQDVVIGNATSRQTRIWHPATGRWRITELPVVLVVRDAEGNAVDQGVRFGVLRKDAAASLLVRNREVAGMWYFDGDAWIAVPAGLSGLEMPEPVFTSLDGIDQGVRLRDLDLDGDSELMIAGPSGRAVFQHFDDGWRKLPITLPAGLDIVDQRGRDAGLRFVDFDQDGRDDIVFSDARRCAAYAFDSIENGWSRKEFDLPRRGDSDELPMIVRADGTDNGAWFSHGHMWVQNEDTGASLPDHVDRRSFATDFRGAGGEPRIDTAVK
ncbi:MAG: VCBS repeat-containing protein [Planctomycetes bacterium]|nr:VCBS repeat-containing protein [Planctomycetota bacterium]